MSPPTHLVSCVPTHLTPSMSRFSQTMYAHLPAAKSVAAFVERHIVAFNVGMLGGAVLLIAFYIGQVNVAISKGYVVNNLQDQIQQLTDENGRLELAVSRMQTLDHVQQAMQILGMVPAEQPTYLAESNPDVAMAGN